MPTIDALHWRTMTAAINQIPSSPRLLQDLLFKNRVTNSTDTIDVDIVVGGVKIAPFVGPSSEGKIIEKLSGKTRSVKTPKIRLKKPFTARELIYNRGPGNIVYANGSGDVTQERNRIIARELADLKNRTENTIEYMCSQALKGSYSVENDDTSFAIDFQMPSANKPVLLTGDAWNEAGGDVIEDLDDWGSIIRNATGMPPDIAIVGDNVVKALRNNAKLQTQFDLRRNDSGTGFEWKTTQDYIGRLNGVDFYRYGQTFTDLNGTTQDFLDEDVCVLASSQARYSIEFGVIEDLKAGNKIQAEYFSKQYEQEDPSALWLLSESRPLPVLWQPEAIVYATVCVAAATVVDPDEGK